MIVGNFHQSIYCLAIAALLGCSQKEPDAQADPGEAKAIPTAGIPASSFRNPAEAAPATTPATASPVPRNETVENEAADWLTPYLNDDMLTIALLDLRQLGSMGPALPEMLRAATTGEVEPSASSQFEQIAAVWTPATATEKHPSQRVAVLARTTMPIDDKAKSAVKALARLAVQKELDVWRAKFDKLGEATADYEPQVEVRGDTIIAAPKSYLPRIAAANSGSNSNIAKKIRAAGTHAVVYYNRPNPKIQAWLKSFEDELFDPALTEPLPVSSAMSRFSLAHTDLVTTVDFDPTWSVQSSITSSPEFSAEKLLEFSRQFAVSFRRPGALGDLARADIDQLEDWLWLTIGAPMFDEGKLSETDKGVSFLWQASPDYSRQMAARLSRVSDEMKITRETRSRQNAIRNVWMALIACSHKRNSMPQNICDENGKPLLSWRIELLPDLEEYGIWKAIRRNEPWDSEHNRKVLSKVPRLFASHPDTPDGHADIFAVLGDPELGFRPDRPSGEVLKYEDFTDDMDDTLLVLHVDPARSVPWAKPDDFHWDPEKPTDGLGHPSEAWFLAGTTQSSAKKISRKENAETLRQLFGRRNSKAVKLLPVYE